MTLSFAPERIEMWSLAKLQPYARNAKAHGADQVAKIAASMAEFGWTVPCLVAEDGELIAGHGRVLAATQLGLTEAPVIVLGQATAWCPLRGGRVRLWRQRPNISDPSDLLQALAWVGHCSHFNVSAMGLDQGHDNPRISPRPNRCDPC